MKQFIEVLVEYFNVELPLLEHSYHWKIPKIQGFHLAGERGYVPNVKLKQYFSAQWAKANAQERISLSKVVVSDWGGVKSNKVATLKAYVDEINKQDPSLPLKGIASYSKIFSIVDMTKYAIYDARVAVCLNAVQWNAGLAKGIAFNYIAGRNNVTGHQTKKIGFAHKDEFLVRNLVNKGWQRVKRDETYQVYLDALKECLKYLPSYKLHDLEMVLFANAEKECSKAMSTLTGEDVVEYPPKKVVVRTLKTATKKITKKFLAENIFNEHANKTRNEILALFKSEAGLTEAGAATYYQNIINSRITNT